MFLFIFNTYLVIVTAFGQVHDFIKLENNKPKYQLKYYMIPTDYVNLCIK